MSPSLLLPKCSLNISKPQSTWREKNGSRSASDAENSSVQTWVNIAKAKLRDFTKSSFKLIF